MKASVLLLALVLVSGSAVSAAAQDREITFPETAVPLKPLMDPVSIKPAALESELQGLKRQLGWKRLIARSHATDKLQAQWGMTGTSAEGERFSIALYDFENADDAQQPITFLDLRRGASHYQAFLKLPAGALTKQILAEAGQTAVLSALEKAEEWYVAADGSIQEAHSFKTCFRKTSFKHCPGFCTGSVAACAGAAATLAAGSAGIGVAAAILVFVGCSGGLCAGCFAVAALSCIG